MAPKAFKILQVVVLLKRNEGEPIVRIHFGKNKPIQNGRSRKSVLIDDKPRRLMVFKFVNLLFYSKNQRRPYLHEHFRNSQLIQKRRNRGKYVLNLLSFSCVFFFVPKTISGSQISDYRLALLRRKTS